VQLTMKSATASHMYLDNETKEHIANALWAHA